MQAFGATPFSVITFAGPTPNAPDVRCRQRLHALVPPDPQPMVNAEQSASAVHGDGSHDPPPDTHAFKVEAVLQLLPFSGPPLQTPRKSETSEPVDRDRPQKPQKTRFMARKSAAAFACDPVDRVNGTGIDPTNGAGGGQSWLV
jgi:hypothetical protein